MLSGPKKLEAKLLFTALQILQDNGSELSAQELFVKLDQRLTLDEKNLSSYDIKGTTSWQLRLRFFSVTAGKAGFLLKQKGIWYLTPEGSQALTLGEEGLWHRCIDEYRRWDKQREGGQRVDRQPLNDESSEGAEEDLETDPVSQQALVIDDLQGRAYEGLKNQILRKDPYQLQDLVAALLRGMGYYTPFTAPKGKDGGADVIAYRDPLGSVSPRIKVQVKHRPDTPSTVKEIRELLGLLRKDGDVGIFVSTGGYTADAKLEVRSANTHIELIDLKHLIALWQEFYPKLNDEDKNLLSLIPIYFYLPNL